jgi:hypothetical protein
VRGFRPPNGIIRHVQLKSSFVGSTVREVSVNTKLLAKLGRQHANIAVADGCSEALLASEFPRNDRA